MCLVATAVDTITKDGWSFLEEDLIDRSLHLCSLLRFEFLFFRVRIITVRDYPNYRSVIPVPYRKASFNQASRFFGFAELPSLYSAAFGIAGARPQPTSQTLDSDQFGREAGVQTSDLIEPCTDLCS